MEHRLIGYAVCEFERQTLHVRDFLVDPNTLGAAAHFWRELAREAFRIGCASVSVELLGCELVQRQLRDAGLIARNQSPLYADIKDQSLPLLQERHWYLTSADVDG